VTDRAFLTDPSRISAGINSSSKDGNTLSHVILNRDFQAATSW